MSLTGRTLAGRYLVEELLGEGSYGAVYAAKQIDLGRPVALKALHAAVAVSTDGLMRFEREARAAAALGHPNIAAVTDFQHNPDEPPFLVMERLNGGTLGEALDREGRMPVLRVAWIAHQVLAALDVAHRANIVHRDVKAANIFLVSAPGIQDFVKLLDFGVAKLTPGDGSKLTASGVMMGSPAYMAPEQIGGYPFDHRVDIYALGATMYRAASGRLPFDAPNLHQLVSVISHSSPAPLSSFDPNMDPTFIAIVNRAMHKDPNGRFASAAEMRAALEPFTTMTIRNQPRATHAEAPTHPSSLAALPPPPPIAPMPYGPPPTADAYSAPPPKKGNGVIIGLLVAVVLLLLLIAAGIGGFLFYARRASDPPTSASSVPSAAAPVTVATTPSASGTPPTPGAPTPLANGKPRPDAGAVAVVDAGAPSPSPVVGSKQFAGSSTRLGGGVFGDYSDGMAIVGRYLGAINPCYAKTEFTPPDHQFEVFNVGVDTAGNTTTVTPGGDPHPVLFPCVAAVIRTIKWPAHPKGPQQLQIHFTSRTKDNP